MHPLHKNFQKLSTGMYKKARYYGCVYKMKHGIFPVSAKKINKPIKQKNKNK